MYAYPTPTLSMHRGVILSFVNFITGRKAFPNIVRGACWQRSYLLGEVTLILTLLTQISVSVNMQCNLQVLLIGGKPRRRLDSIR